MIRVLEPENVARELNDRVLETASGPDHRDTAFPCVPNRSKRPIHTPIGTGGRDPQSVKRRQGLRGVIPNLIGGHPDEIEPDVAQSVTRKSMCQIGRVKIPHDANRRMNSAVHDGSIHLMPRVERIISRRVANQMPGSFSKP